MTVDNKYDNRMTHMCLRELTEEMNRNRDNLTLTLKKKSPEEKSSNYESRKEQSGSIRPARDRSFDRFIPCRIEEESQRFLRGDISPDRDPMTPSHNIPSTFNSRKEAFRKILKQQFFSREWCPYSSISNPSRSSRLLKFNQRKPLTKLRTLVVGKPLEKLVYSLPSQPKLYQEYDFYPSRSVSAKGLEDDFYINVVDWSAQNIIGVSLSSKVFLWNPVSSEYSMLCGRKEEWNDGVTSLKFDHSGDHVVIGNENGTIRLVKVETGVEVTKLKGQSSRVGVSTWVDRNILVCGSQDGVISIHDVRSGKKPEKLLYGFHQEVCGLTYCPLIDKLASGCNSSLINIWDLRKNESEQYLRQHKSAVRGLAWSTKERGMLYSGGGNKDKTLKVFSFLNNSLARTVNLQSQVTGIVFSAMTGEFVTTHGFMENDIRLWSPFDLSSPLAVFEGHENRVLYSAVSPSGDELLTGSGDESLKLWKIFKNKKPSNDSALHPDYRELR